MCIPIEEFGCVPVVICISRNVRNGLARLSDTYRSQVEDPS